MTFTVLGATGFIGRNMTAHLRQQGFVVATPSRDIDLSGRHLGHVIYAIGVVGGAKNRMQDMITAHALLPQRILQEATFDSFLYLSSTRVYDGISLDTEAREDVALPVLPSSASFFSLTKMTGEAVCLAHPNPAVRVARLSNIYGIDQSPDTFLGSVLRDLAAKASVTFGESLQSSKDYLSIGDATRMLQSIALNGDQRLYNVASGDIVTHAALAEKIKACGLHAAFADGGATRAFPRINTARISELCGGARQHLLDDLPRLIDAARQHQVASA